MCSRALVPGPSVSGLSFGLVRWTLRLNREGMPRMQQMNKGLAVRGMASTNLKKAKKHQPLPQARLVASLLSLAAIVWNEFARSEESVSAGDGKGNWREKWFSVDVILEALPSVQDACKMKVYHASKFLCKAQVEELVKFEERKRSTVGTFERDADGFRRMDSPWRTTYLSTDHVFQEAYPHLVDQLKDLALKADSTQGWNILGRDKNDMRVRVVEIHRVGEHGALPHEDHCDMGSLVTVDCMLSEPEIDFNGGAFCTLEADGKLEKHKFEFGDVVVFPSHKKHCVQPVTGGERTVMIVEFWRGEERDCAHRCEEHLGKCSFSTMRAKAERLLLAANPVIDPW